MTESQAPAPEWPAFVAASDAPWRAADPDDLARTAGVAEQLAQMLASAVLGERAARRKRVSPEIPEARRIGLLGGLGQGKTSALHYAMSQMQSSLCAAPKEDRGPANVVYFDAALELPQALEFEFDRLQASLNFGQMLLRAGRSLLGWIGGIGALLALMVVVAWEWFVAAKVPMDEVIKLGKQFALPAISLIVVSLLPVLAVRQLWPFVQRRGERRYHFGKESGTPGWAAYLRRARMALRALVHRVDVLVVDNLDRASIVQQRAMLRSIYKHQDEVRCMIVVAFDESALLRHGGPDPEAPEQLLAKAIEVSLRVPDRLPVEALQLSRLAAAAMPQAQWRRAVQQWPVSLALAEAVLALGPLSPRTAKRLLNDACALLSQLPGRLRAGSSQQQTELKAARLEVRVLEWLPALLRLQVLWQACGALRSHPLALSEALASMAPKDLRDLQALLAEADAKLIAPCLADSGHLRPRRGEWLGLVAAMSTLYWHPDCRIQAALDPLPAVPLALLDSLWDAIDHYDPMRRDDAWQGLAGFVNVNADELTSLRQHLLPVLRAVLTLWVMSPSGKGRANSTLAHMLEACASTLPSWLQHGDGDGAFRRWLCRALVARAATTAGVEELARWLRWAGPATSTWRWNTLMLRSPAGITWPDLWELLAVADVVPGTGDPELEFDFQARRRWVDGLDRVPAGWSVLRVTLVQAAQQIGNGCTELLHAWPGVGVGESASPLCERCVDDWRVLRAVHLATGGGIVVPPRLLDSLRRHEVGAQALLAMVEWPGQPGIERWSIALVDEMQVRAPEAFSPLSWAAWAEQAANEPFTRGVVLLALARCGLAALDDHRRLLSAHGSAWPSGERWVDLVFAAVQFGLGASTRKAQLAAWVDLFKLRRALLRWLGEDVLGGALGPDLETTQVGARAALRKLR